MMTWGPLVQEPGGRRAHMGFRFAAIGVVERELAKGLLAAYGYAGAHTRGQTTQAEDGGQTAYSR